MKPLHALPLIVAAAAGVMLTGGCSAVGCTDNQNSVPLAGFYSYTTLQAITLDSIAIGGVGAPNDSLLLSPSESASQVYLPLRSTATQTQFVITYKQAALAALGLEDAIIIDYESTPWFASEECGAMYHYHITSLRHTTNLIDSIAITAKDSIITNVETETLQIYFRTAEADEEEDE